MGVVVLLAFLLVPNFLRARAPGHYTACKSNLKNLATGLEGFREKARRYPDRLDALVPGHLSAIPTCPTSGKDTYRGGYLISGDATQFTLMCRGDNHSRVGRPPDFPQYDSHGGLREEP